MKGGGSSPRSRGQPWATLPPVGWVGESIVGGTVGSPTYYREILIFHYLRRVH